MGDDTTTEAPTPRKRLSEVGVMQKIEALINGLSLSAQRRIVDYFTAAVDERIARRGEEPSRPTEAGLGIA